MSEVEQIITNYAAGYFLMATEDVGLHWYKSRRQRAIVPLDDRFRYPRSLRRSLKHFRIEIDTAFDQVVEGCADRPETWISEDLKDIYHLLHQAGWAHSFETWQGHQLAGGILGIAIGGAFIGESMFYQIPEGSKVAMVQLVQHLRQQGFTLFDAQMQNPHLERFGAQEIDPQMYDELLAKAVAQPCQF